MTQVVGGICQINFPDGPLLLRSGGIQMMPTSRINDVFTGIDGHVRSRILPKIPMFRITITDDGTSATDLRRVQRIGVDGLQVNATIQTADGQGTVHTFGGIT